MSPENRRTTTAAVGNHLRPTAFIFSYFHEIDWGLLFPSWFWTFRKKLEQIWSPYEPGINVWSFEFKTRTPGARSNAWSSLASRSPSNGVGHREPATKTRNFTLLPPELWKNDTFYPRSKISYIFSPINITFLTLKFRKWHFGPWTSKFQHLFISAPGLYSFRKLQFTPST